MKRLILGLVVVLAGALLTLASTPVSAAPPTRPDHPNFKLIPLPARAFPHVYENVSPERYLAPTFTGTVLTTSQTRSLRDSGALGLARSIAPYNYNEMAGLIEAEANRSLQLSPPGCIRIYYTPRGKNPRYPAAYVASIAAKYCMPPYLIP